MQIDAKQLKIPNPPIPRPGEEVFWYAESVPFQGKMVGYNINEQPLVTTKFGSQTNVESFYHLRLNNPFNRIDPNWHRLPPEGKIIKAQPEQIAFFNSILSQRIPPGPKYIDLVSEIYNRGFEVFLVGGTVRDIIFGDKSHDVDLVTTMPVKYAEPLINSMYGKNYSINGKTGYVRIGGKPSSGDPFIDLKNFPIFSPGSTNAIFGSDFNVDLCHRDFACNSIYYDPINMVYVDPSGRGVDDAKSKTLFIVKDLSYPSPYYHCATILVRFVKFVNRGYRYLPETLDELQKKYIPLIPTMPQSYRLQYVKTQFLSKSPKEQHEQLIIDFKTRMLELGLEEVYNQFFIAIETEIK